MVADKSSKDKWHEVLFWRLLVVFLCIVIVSFHVSKWRDKVVCGFEATTQSVTKGRDELVFHLSYVSDLSHTTHNTQHTTHNLHLHARYMKSVVIVGN